MWNTLAPIYDQVIARLLNHDIVAIKALVEWRTTDTILDLGGTPV